MVYKGDCGFCLFWISLNYCDLIVNIDKSSMVYKSCVLIKTYPVFFPYYDLEGGLGIPRNGWYFFEQEKPLWLLRFYFPGFTLTRDEFIFFFCLK